MTDHIITTTLTPAEQAAFESGRKAGLREAAKCAHTVLILGRAVTIPDAIRALIKEQK